MKQNLKCQRVAGIGNALVDVLARIPSDDVLDEMGLKRGGMELVDEEGFNRLSRRLRKMDAHLSSGGSAHNTIYALSQLGAETGFIGKRGNDEYGNYLEQDYLQSGIKPMLSVSGKLPTGVASTFVSPDGQRTFGTFLGAAASVEADDVSASQLEGYDWLYIEGYLVQNHSLIERAARLAHEAGLGVALDLASWNIVEAERPFFKRLLDGLVDIVFANEDESRAFTGIDNPGEAASLLARSCKTAVVKTGARGAVCSDGRQTVAVPATAVPRVVDTTGAGDFFAGGFMFAFTAGASLEKCLRVGNLLGGQVVQVLGTSLSHEAWQATRLEAQRIMAGQ